MEITEQEKEIAKKIGSVLATKYIGKEKAISGSKITSRIEDHKVSVSSEKLRAMVQWLRLCGYRICSSSKGYWYAANKQEFLDCMKSLKSRIDSQVQTLLAMKKIVDTW